MSDNLQALRGVRDDARNTYLDYEDEAIAQERAHYPAVCYIDAQAELIAALEAANSQLRQQIASHSADELQAVLKWINAKLHDIHQRVEPYKSDHDALWNSGLLDEKVTADEWREEILQALARQPDADAPDASSRPQATTTGSEGGG